MNKDAIFGKFDNMSNTEIKAYEIMSGYGYHIGDCINFETAVDLCQKALEEQYENYKNIINDVWGALNMEFYDDFNKSDIDFSYFENRFYDWLFTKQQQIKKQ